jgi:hypothetical protein
VNSLALIGSSDLGFRRQLEMVEVVDHVLDDFGGHLRYYGYYNCIHIDRVRAEESR